MKIGLRLFRIPFALFPLRDFKKKAVSKASFTLRSGCFLSSKAGKKTNRFANSCVRFVWIIDHLRIFSYFETGSSKPAK